LRSYLISQAGIRPEEVDNAIDHRVFVLAEKARRYDELKSRIELSRKKVAKAPKMPTGRTVPPETGNSRKLQDAKARLKQDHTVESAAKVFEHLKVI
jgi:hypothetical protein